MDSSARQPTLIPAGFAVDDRGQVTFANEFSFHGIQRFYLVENFSTDIIRAFHGHLREDKYVFAVSGSAIVAAVELDNTAAPNAKNRVYRFVLSARQPALLHIPAGYANGFRALERDTKLLFLSTSTLEAAKADDYRLPYDYWGKDIWSVEPR